MLICRNYEGVHGQRKVGNPCSKPGATNMRPTKEFRAAREAFRRDQQLLLSFVVCSCWWTIFFVFNRFHSM